MQAHFGAAKLSDANIHLAEKPNKKKADLISHCKNNCEAMTDELPDVIL